MQGNIAKHVTNISSEKACAMYVKQEYPEAPSATWYNESGCWAEFGEHKVYSSLHRTCLFQGIFITLNNNDHLQIIFH